jgi:hypothetical protein
MALLADHLATTTRQRHPRATVIAELLRGWAPWIRGETYLTGKHVYNRIRRVKESKDFRRDAREEKLRAHPEDSRIKPGRASRVPTLSLPDLLWCPQPPLGLAGENVAGNRAIGTPADLGGPTTGTTMAGAFNHEIERLSGPG